MGDRSPKDAEKRKKKAVQKAAKPSQAAPARPDIVVKSPKTGR